MITKLFANHLAEYGIPVNEVRPGIIATGMTEDVAEAVGRGPPETRRCRLHGFDIAKLLFWKSWKRENSGFFTL